MQQYQLEGECNLCGQCCGAIGSPRQTNPWPRGLAKRLADTDHEIVKHDFKYWDVLDMRHCCGGKTAIKQRGLVRIDNKSYRYQWHGDGTLGKPERSARIVEQDIDIPPTPASLECPFLAGNPGDEERPCALVNHPGWQKQCREAGPPLTADDDFATSWAERHPQCSLVYKEIPD